MSLPRTWLLALASLLWCIPASLLLSRAYVWTEHFSSLYLSLSFIGIAVSVALIYGLGFRKIVLQNIARIRSLPVTTRIWRVSSHRGYGMVGIMVLIGMLLRGSDVPTVWLAGPYALMGGCLLVGSIHLAGSFLRDVRSEEY